MQVFRKIQPLILIAILGFGCKKTIVEKTVYDNVIYGLDTVYVYSSNLEKTKNKTPGQYLSIMYADIYKESIPPDVVADLEELNLALGDKLVANDLVISYFLNSPDADVPSDAAMRADIDKFIEDTYRKFYLRHPTEYEKYQFTQMIQNDPDLSPDQIYAGFILSNEYFYY